MAVGPFPLFSRAPNGVTHNHEQKDHHSRLGTIELEEMKISHPSEGINHATLIVRARTAGHKGHPSLQP